MKREHLCIISERSFREYFVGTETRGGEASFVSARRPNQRRLKCEK
jgi:hypothetical protein